MFLIISAGGFAGWLTDQLQKLNISPGCVCVREPKGEKCAEMVPKHVIHTISTHLLSVITRASSEQEDSLSGDEEALGRW